MRANAVRARLLSIISHPLGRAGMPNDTTDDKQTLKRRLSRFSLRFPLRAPVATESALLFANAILGAVLGVLFWTVAARVYSVPSVGFSAAIVSAATLVATFANLGLGAVVVRFLPTAGNRGRALCIAATGIPAMAAVVIVSVGMAFPVWPLAGDLLAGGVWGILLPSALAVIMSGMFVQDSIFIARHQARQVLVRGVGSGIARLLLILPLAGWGAYGLLGVFLGGACVSVALGVKAWGAQSPPVGIPHPQDQQPGKWPTTIPGGMARYAGTNYLSGLFAQAPQLLYPVLIASQISNSAAGAFAFAWMAGALLLQLPASAANVLMSRLARDPSDAERSIRQATRVLLAAMAGLCVITGIGVAIFANLFLPAISREIISYLPLLLVGTLPFAWIRMRSMSMALNDDLRSLMLLNGTVAVLAVAMPLALLPAYGVLGLEAGWVASQGLGVLLSLLFRKFRPPFRY